MKKRLFIFLSVLVLIFAAFWFFIVKKSAVKNDIPNYADMVICIDSQNIRNTILKHYLFNPSDYFTEGDSTESPLGKIGIEMPKYIVAFSANTKSLGTLFSEFNLSDKVSFQKFIDQQGFIKEQFKDCDIYKEPLSSNLFFATNTINNSLVAGYGLKSIDSNSFGVARDLLLNNNLLSKSDKIYSTLKKSSNHIIMVIKENSYVNKQSLLSLNFLDGKIKVEGDIHNKKEYAFGQKSKSINDTGAILNMSFNGTNQLIDELISNTDKNWFKTKTNMNIDSLNHYFDKSLVFQLKNLQTTYDTAISYSYDENFNAVEEQLITESAKPEFNCLLLKAKPNAFGYFLRDSIVKTVDGENVFVPYPLQKVLCNNLDNSVLLSSGNLSTNIVTENVILSKEESDCFLSLYANFSSLKNENEIGGISIKNIDNIQVNCVQKEVVNLDAELVFKNKEKPAIFSFLEILTDK